MQRSNMEPHVNVAVKPHRQTKPPSQMGQLIALRNERAETVARNARLGKALTLAAMSLGYGALGDRLGARLVFHRRLCHLRLGVARLCARAGLAGADRGPP